MLYIICLSFIKGIKKIHVKYIKYIFIYNIVYLSFIKGKKKIHVNSVYLSFIKTIKNYS